MARDNAARQQAGEDEDLEERRQALGDEDKKGIEVDLADLGSEDDDRKASGKTGRDQEERERDVAARGALDDANVDADREREARRAARREERKRREEREAQREEEREARIDQLQQTVGTLTQELAQRRDVDVRSAFNNMEAEKQDLVRQYEEAKALKEKAWKDQDAGAATRADEIMYAARDRYATLEVEQRRLAAAVHRQQQQPRGPHPEVAKHYQAFAKEFSWYDRQGGDEDSAATLAIDRKMYADGWDPTTPGYWKELRRRMRAELPHRFDEDRGRRGDDEDRGERRERQKFRHVGGGDDDSRGGGDLGGGRYHIPAEYVKNLKDAGFWGDEVNPSKEELATRNRMIRRYIAGLKQAEQRRR